MKRKYFKDFHLAGFKYYDGALVFDQLKIGTKLRLQRESDNAHDPEAIEIYFDVPVVSSKKGLEIEADSAVQSAIDCDSAVGSAVLPDGGEVETCECKSYKLGYVPRHHNDELATFLDQGFESIFDVRINRISKDNVPESQIGLVVHLLSNPNE